MHIYDLDSAGKGGGKVDKTNDLEVSVHPWSHGPGGSWAYLITVNERGVMFPCSRYQQRTVCWWPSDERLQRATDALVAKVHRDIIAADAEAARMKRIEKAAQRDSTAG